MIERIVDYWLTNSTERAFQIPFAQVLALRGERVLHISKHGVGEQGKDIICQLPGGTYAAYQLKTGNINKSTWQKIYGEIVELIELPIQYPGANESGHIPTMVTNGTITDDVRLSIQALNDGNSRRGFRPLQVIEQTALQHLFVEAHGRYLPLTLPDLKTFLDLFNSDGRQNLKRSQFADYLSSLLHVRKRWSSRDALRRITNATLLAGYLLAPYVSAANHIAICEAWVMVSAYTYHFAHHTGLDPSAIEPILQLLQQGIERELELLTDEVHQRDGNLVEGTPVGDGELMYSVRVTVVLGWLATYHLIRKRRDPTYPIPPFLLELIESHSQHVGIWGEYAIPFICALSSLKRQVGDSEAADSLIAGLLRTIVEVNNARNRTGFPSPYHTPDDLISSYYSMPGTEIDLTQFSGNSYVSRALVDTLVHLDRRDLLGSIWKTVTETRSIEYYPSNPIDMLLWRSDNGAERDFAYPLPTSFGSLRSALPDETQIPDSLRRGSDFAALFVLTYPHRFRRDLHLEMVRHGF